MWKTQNIEENREIQKGLESAPKNKITVTSKSRIVM